MSRGRFPRRAEWIWRERPLRPPGFSDAPPPAAEEANRWVYFRKLFVLDAAPRAAAVHVSADGRYRLFVNGRAIGRGPARGAPHEQCVDPYDLAPYLAAGHNVLAALVHSYGRTTAWYELPRGEAARAFGCGGFFVQGEVVLADGRIRLDTDASWRHLVSEAWKRDVPSGSLGFVEVHDARKEPAGWTEPGFDDASWKRSQVLRVSGLNFSSDVVPFPVLVPRDIPPLASEERDAQTIARRDATIVCDFGGTVSGHLGLELEGPAGAEVEVRWSERLAPDGRVLLHRGIPGFDVPQIHRGVLRQGAQTWRLFEAAGFRYVELTFTGEGAAPRLTRAFIERTGYPVAERGRFACSDSLLNRIWKAGAETVRLCMHDAYVDCPSRERRQWVGDAYVETLVNYAAFGDTLLTARFLRQVAASQTPDGLTAMAAPGDFAASGFTNIPDFCLLWILALGRHVEYAGDDGLVAELWPAVAKALGWFERHLGADGLLVDVPHWVFLDWAELDKHGEVAALNALFVAALRAAAWLSRRAGSEREAAGWDALASRVTDAVNARFWDEARGVYVDALRGETLSRRVSQQTNAAVIASGLAPAERWASVFDAILDETRLRETRFREAEVSVSPFDIERHIVLAQPFFAHFLHGALARAGRLTDLLRNIRRRWGPMLEEGNGTFWERWTLDPLASLCHGYAATPTFDLSTNVLGVTPAAPGFERFRIAPIPGDLEWAEGVFPTPKGEIGVAWRKDGDGGFELTLDVPEGTEAGVELPASGRLPFTRVEVDGRAAGATLSDLRPGHHRIAAARA